jgi:hypothetical protein
MRGMPQRPCGSTLQHGRRLQGVWTRGQRTGRRFIQGGVESQRANVHSQDGRMECASGSHALLWRRRGLETCATPRWSCGEPRRRAGALLRRAWARPPRLLRACSRSVASVLLLGLSGNCGAMGKSERLAKKRRRACRGNQTNSQTKKKKSHFIDRDGAPVSGRLSAAQTAAQEPRAYPVGCVATRWWSSCASRATRARCSRRSSRRSRRTSSAVRPPLRAHLSRARMPPGSPRRRAPTPPASPEDRPRSMSSPLAQSRTTAPRSCRQGVQRQAVHPQGLCQVGAGGGHPRRGAGPQHERWRGARRGCGGRRAVADQ